LKKGRKVRRMDEQATDMTTERTRVISRMALVKTRTRVRRMAEKTKAAPQMMARRSTKARRRQYG
jgi:hypothetical protein